MAQPRLALLVVLIAAGFSTGCGSKFGAVDLSSFEEGGQSAESVGDQDDSLASIAATTAPASTGFILHPTRVTVPARIEAENFSTARDITPGDACNQNLRPGGNVDICRCVDEGVVGNKVAAIDAGEWLSYEINVPKTGTYDIFLRVSREPLGRSAAEIHIDGVNKSGFVPIPSTGGWSKYATVHALKLQLLQGHHALKVNFTGGFFNLNWIEVKEAVNPEADPVPAQPTPRPAPPATQPAPQPAPTPQECRDTQTNPNGPIRQECTINQGPQPAPQPSATPAPKPSATPAPATPAPKPSATPAPATPAPARVTVPARIQAESYTSARDVTPGDACNRNLRPGGNVDICRTTDGGVEGNKVAQIELDEWLAYQINVTTAGQYEFLFRVSRQDLGNAAMEIHIDGVNQSGYVPVPSTGSWETFQTIRAGGIPLTVGQHEVKLVFRGGYLNLNWFEIKKTKLDLPGVLQAEDFKPGAEGVAFHDNTPGRDHNETNYRYTPVEINKGVEAGNFVIGYIQANEWLAYEVNVPQAAAYTLALRTAKGSAGSSQVKVFVDGVAVLGTLAAPTTGGWSTYLTWEAGKLNLTPGKHEIKILFVNGDLNFDWFRMD